MNATAAIPAHISPRVNVVPASSGLTAVLDAVRVGHDEPDRGEQAGVRGELQVERPPRGPDRLGCPIGDADRLGSDDAHQSFW